MGLISNILNIGKSASPIGGAIKNVAEVFIPNRTKTMEAEHAKRMASLDQYSHEFQHEREGWFAGFTSGINRLPRPMMAFGTLGLFLFAMIDPPAFSERMTGLALVPDPLWWLLGAIVSFYFGARELHHIRVDRVKHIDAQVKLGVVTAKVFEAKNNVDNNTNDPYDNAALNEWKQLNMTD